MIVSEKDVEDALNFLSETDETYAEMEGEMLLAEKRVERVKDRLYLSADGTVAERKALANKSAEVAVEEENQIKAMVAFKTLKAKRETARIRIDVWRSLSAARRVGL